MTRFVIVAVAALLASTAAAAQTPPASAPTTRSYQGKSLLGEPMYTDNANPVNVTSTDTLLRAVADAKAAAERDPTIDSITWYGRVVGYQGLARETIAIYDAGLKRYPNSAKLLRHRAHRYFNLREFDKSIADGLKAAALSEGQPLEREKLGPDYFPATPDVVQFYLYYHLGGAYFAKHDFDNAAKWFGKSYEVALATNDVGSETAATYWTYLSLARGNRFSEANALLDGFGYTIDQVSASGEPSNYFDGIQLFRGNRSALDFYSERDQGKAFGTSDGIKASTSYTLANYWLLRGERDKAREWLARAMSIGTWSFFARVQAEADWVQLWGTQKP